MYILAAHECTITLLKLRFSFPQLNCMYIKEHPPNEKIIFRTRYVKILNKTKILLLNVNRHLLFRCHYNMLCSQLSLTGLHFPKCRYNNNNRGRRGIEGQSDRGMEGNQREGG